MEVRVRREVRVRVRVMVGVVVTVRIRVRVRVTHTKKQNGRTNKSEKIGKNEWREAIGNKEYPNQSYRSKNDARCKLCEIRM